MFERSKATPAHRFVSLLNRYSQVCCLFPTCFIFNISQYNARTVMFVCVIVTQYRLRHVVVFCKYMVHNISISFSFIPCYLYVSFASSCVVFFRFWKINQLDHPCYVRTKATAVLPFELLAPLCCSIICVLDRTYWQCFKKTSFYKQWK
jgi:hypothetical protein